ncbi:hypothetical protein LJC59_04710 [Desulfovibrio sp. OttesenSCG-928-A18]|nr:hypothetical protein [Desulfovibrio sp. OttesenSCG-928-A18]
MHRRKIYARLCRLQRWDEACELTAELMREQPLLPLWPLLCAEAHASAGRFDEAIACASEAQHRFSLLKDQDAEEAMGSLWHSIGLSALLAEAGDSAVTALEQALALFSDNEDLLFHYALAMQLCSRHKEAAAVYGRLLALAPRHVQARINQIFCLVESGDQGAAARSLDQWPQETSPPAHLEKALARSSVLEAQGRHAEALQCLDPCGRSFSEAPVPELEAALHASRGRLLRLLGKNAEALPELTEAFRLQPASGRNAAELADLYLDLGRQREEGAVWRQHIARGGRPELAEARAALNIPAVLESGAQAVLLRRRLSTLFHEGGEGPVLAPPLALMGMPPFFLAFHGLDDAALLSDMARFLIQRTSLRHAPKIWPPGPASGPVPAPAPGPVPDRTPGPMPGQIPDQTPGQLPDQSPGLSPDRAEKHARIRQLAAALRPPAQRRIAFISRHFSNHTIMSYFFRVLLCLCPRLPHCLLLEFPQEQNAFRNELARVGRLLTLPPRLEAARQTILDLDLDILVYLDLGLDPGTWFLAFSRLATLQCCLYGHPMTTGIPNLDIFLSPAAMETPDAEVFYSETLLRLPGLGSGFMPPSPAGSRAGGAGRSGRKTVYLCAQSLFKIHPDMDEAFRSILGRDLDARLHLFRSSREWETEALRLRLRGSLGPHFSRLRWLKQCGEEEFLRILQEADAVLDSFPFSGGGTSFKALGGGVPLITLEGRFMRGRQSSALYRQLDVDGCTARTKEEYCDLALSLAHSPEKKAALRGELLARKDRLFALDESVDYLEQLLLGDSVPDF